MRCPNCGNENPADYMFCDECGARLGGAETPGVATDVNTGTNQGTDPTQQYSDIEGGKGQLSGPIGSAPSSTATTEESSYQSPMSYPDAMSGELGGANQADHSAGVPVTEDTIVPAVAAADAGDNSSHAATQEAQIEMPGVLPLQQPGQEEETQGAGAYSAAGQDQAATPPAQAAAVETMQSSAAPVAPEAAASAGADSSAWAASALRQLHEAQNAIVQGDWGQFGQAMQSLRQMLESATQGAVAPSLPPSPQYAQPSAPPSLQVYSTAGAPASSSTQVGGGDASIPEQNAEAEPYTGSGGVGTIEPAAEAGNLGTQGVPVGQATQESQGPGVARLVVISTGAELPLPDQEEITVGREDPSSGIFPDVDLTPYGGEEGGVSRRHARLLHVGDDYFAEDLQSTNYTKIDGQRLPAHVREKLEDGARLDFGRIALIFRRS